VIDDLWTFLVDAQQDYYQMTGRYFQGFWTHGQAPRNSDYPDGWLLHPTDQQYRWADLGAFGLVRMSFSMAIDVYSSPEGDGWIACYRTFVASDTWQRCRVYGPLVNLATDWEIVQ
jgi:hypothetical protein